MDRDLRVPYVMSEDSIDLIRSMLERDVGSRITIEGVMEHPWCQEIVEWVREWSTISAREVEWKRRGEEATHSDDPTARSLYIQPRRASKRVFFTYNFKIEPSASELIIRIIAVATLVFLGKLIWERERHGDRQKWREEIVCSVWV